MVLALVNLLGFPYDGGMTESRTAAARYATVKRTPLGSDAYWCIWDTAQSCEPRWAWSDYATREEAQAHINERNAR